jgi:hypothetical protein
MKQVNDTNQSRDRLNRYFEKARQDLTDVEEKRKDIIRNLALNIEREALVPTEWICEEIMKALQGCGVSSQDIRKCLDKRYKRKYEQKEVEQNAPSFVFNLNTFLDLVYGTLVSKLNDEIRGEELEELTKEDETKQALILLQRQRIEELESHPIQEHKEEQTKQQRNIEVPTKIWHQLQSMAVSKQIYINMVVENGKYLRLEPIKCNKIIDMKRAIK